MQDVEDILEYERGDSALDDTFTNDGYWFSNSSTGPDLAVICFGQSPLTSTPIHSTETAQAMMRADQTPQPTTCP